MINGITLSEAFEDKAPPPPAMDQEAYYLLLQNLMAQGQGYGKTEPTAAYLFRNLNLVNSDTGKEGTVEIKPVYLVMDLNEWPNEYGRSLMVKDIWEQYINAIIEDEEINAPDFEGPGLWTAKQSSFQDDYIRRTELTENGKRVHTYDPNPEAYRICLNIKKTITIPVAWGTYTIKDGGTLAVRSRDIEKLTDALISIKNGTKTINEALYITDEKDKIVSIFDVYGMEPNFLNANYKPLTLEQPILDHLAKFKTDKIPPSKQWLKDL